MTKSKIKNPNVLAEKLNRDIEAMKEQIEDLRYQRKQLEREAQAKLANIDRQIQQHEKTIESFSQHLA